MKRVGLILAAGQSRRFGREDKLLAPFRGKPLATWSARAMRSLPLDHLLAVTGSDSVARLFPGFDCLPGAGPDAGQAASLRIGVARAQALGADRLLIALADMPFIGHGVMAEVLATCRDDCGAATTDGDRRMPPACFPSAMFDRLQALDGDRGAGRMLAQLPPETLVELPSTMLADLDRQEDFEMFGGPDEDAT